MARALSRTFTKTFAGPPDSIWRALADTARFNEAAKLPKHAIEERLQPDGSVQYFGSARIGPFRLYWEDHPANWVANCWLEHCRSFRRGPLATLCARLALTTPASGCRAEYTVEATPAGLVGRLLLRFGFLEASGRMFDRLAGDVARFAEGLSESPFAFQPPRTAPEVRRRVDAMVRQIEETGHGHGLAARLAEYVLTAQQVDLVHLRPLRLAREWAVGEREAIELFLEAVRAGLLRLRWDLLCPRCRVPKAAVLGLDELPRGAHCATCNIDYERDFSANVELSFSPSPTVRPIEAGEYCLFGPMSTPHVWVQLTLDAASERRVAAALPPGAYRLRTLEPGPAYDLTWDGGGFPEVVLTDDAVAAEAPAAPGEIRIVNRTARRLTAVIEERAWARDALVADRVATVQVFRDLFSDQVLRPGDEVSVRRVTLMFTDLRESTALYGRIGDAGAYNLVREQFAYIGDIVRRHDGAVVKTIGDAVMAAFADPARALGAALEIQRDVARLRQAPEAPALVVKLGLHEGPCIAVTLNGRLDYFGSTVNLAARLEGQSRGGDVVISETMATDPGVAAALEPLEATRETMPLKGFDAPVTFRRLAP